MSFLLTVRARWEGLLRQLASFGVIGALNFVVDTAIWNALFFIGPVKAQVVATVVATTMSYFLNRHWTFRAHARSGLRREYTLFFVLNGVGLAITAAIVGLARYGFDLHDQVALNIVRLFAIAVATVFRFWSYRRWVFGATSADPHQAQPGQTDPHQTELGHAEPVLPERTLVEPARSGGEGRRERGRAQWSVDASPVPDAPTRNGKPGVNGGPAANGRPAPNGGPALPGIPGPRQPELATDPSTP